MPQTRTYRFSKATDAVAFVLYCHCLLGQDGSVTRPDDFTVKLEHTSRNLAEDAAAWDRLALIAAVDGSVFALALMNSEWTRLTALEPS